MMRYDPGRIALACVKCGARPVILMHSVLSPKLVLCSNATCDSIGVQNMWPVSAVFTWNALQRKSGESEISHAHRPSAPPGARH